ncbi:hypothetical protein SeMB42_g05477 [Synchytrium endobioticum]|uniref:Nucleolar protein 14 n=1 Tax=Synchytrium endobioticum TaxID=286115 RepID=A0A507DEJ6_9FUNG|nr:hypothetical protein SeMB42_g05477 [Synchytrium endobioticum]TPX49288.1 hypothetical protein SeLEV6574_g01542 [Synchytrium endobioticum]
MKTNKGPSALKKLQQFKKNIVCQFNSANTHKNKKRKAAHAPGTTLSSISASQKSSFQNLFELQISKSKHNVLNRKVTGSVGRPAVLGKKGAEARRIALAHELKERKRDTAFLDKRFGENIDSIPLEDKMLKRSIKVKRSEKRSVFNLEEDTLTHFGRSLDDVGDFTGRDRILEDDSEDEGQVDKKFVSDYHFGGFDKEKDARMSKSDVMKELITKSKHHKALRQQQHEEDMDLIDEVDADLGDIRVLLGPHRNQQNQTVQPSAEDYDQVVQSLKFDARAVPTDRIKSTEEIKLAHERKMQELEADRLRRMRPEGLLSTRRETQGDDLDDDYMTDNNDDPENETDESDSDTVDKEKMKSMQAMPLTYVNGKLINTEIFMKKKRKRDDEEDGDEDCVVGGSAGSQEDDDSDDEAGSFEDMSEEGEVEDRNAYIDDEAKEGEETGENEDAEGDDDIAEEAFGDDDEGIEEGPTKSLFKASVATKSKANDNAAALPSMSSPYHIEKLEATPQKLHQQLAGLRDAMKGGPSALRESLYMSILDALETTELSFEAFEVVAEYMIQLARLCPSVAVKDALKRLARIENQLEDYLSRGRTGKGWPENQDLLLLRLFLVIFPTSDFDHPVATPTMLLLCRFLSLVQIHDLGGVICGLFICNLLYESQMISKRYIPEVMSFLVGVLQLATAQPQQSAGMLFRLPPRDAESDLFVKVDWSAEMKPLNLLSGSAVSDGICVSMISTTIHLVSTFAQLWNSNAAHPEIFGCVHTYLASASGSAPFTNESLKASLDTFMGTLTALMQKAKAGRVPLRFKSRKPVAIPTFMPKFEEGYSMDRRYTHPQRAFIEKKKIAYQYRKEFRATVRELKRDAAFVATERLKAKKEAAEIYNSKIQKIMGGLGTQEGEMRKLEKGFGKKKRR